jgi:hypothetical protein
VRERLIQTLREVGKGARELQSPDGSRIVVLPHGGRVLGLFGPRSSENFLWTSPALGAVETARQLFDSQDWHNTGGDRTWLAPELDFFFPEYPKLDKYFQPRSLDPGSYTVIENHGALSLSNVVTATLSRSGKQVVVDLRKEIGPALDPLRHERDLWLPADLEYAGYSLRTVVGFIDAPGDARVGAWSLLQLPHGGDLFVPTYARSAPKVYFGKVGPEDLLVTDGMVHWRMRSDGEHKIGLRAVATTGRAGYLYPASGQWNLVVRNFPVNPSLEYVDVPWSDPDDLGYSVQACSIKSGLGIFSELEHHAPAAGAGPPWKSEDTSQVWAYRGRFDEVRQVAGRLLGAIP